MVKNAKRVNNMLIGLDEIQVVRHIKKVCIPNLRRTTKICNDCPYRQIAETYINDKGTGYQ